MPAILVDVISGQSDDNQNLKQLDLESVLLCVKNRTTQNASDSIRL